MTKDRSEKSHVNERRERAKRSARGQWPASLSERVNGPDFERGLYPMH